MSASASKSEANQTSTTANYDNRVAADNGAVVVGSGSSATFESMDKEVALAAITGAGDMAKRQADLAHSVTDDSLSFAKGIVDSGATLIGKQLDTSREVQQDNNALATALSTLAVNSANPNATVNDTVKQVAIAGVAGVVLLAGLMLLKNKRHE